MYCSKCGNEIKEEEKTCSKCGKVIENKNNNTIANTIGILIFISSIIFVIMISKDIISDTNEDTKRLDRLINGTQQSSNSTTSTYITLDKFNKIQTGMTYNEVVQIVGSSGSLTSQAGIGEYLSEVYTWNGKDVGSNAVVVFSGGKVIAKSQCNL